MSTAPAPTSSTISAGPPSVPPWNISNLTLPSVRFAISSATNWSITEVVKPSGRKFA